MYVALAEKIVSESVCIERREDGRRTGSEKEKKDEESRSWIEVTDT